MGKKGLRIVVIILVIVLLAAIGAIAWFVTHPNQPAATDTATQQVLSVKDTSANAKSATDAKDKDAEAAASGQAGGGASSVHGSSSAGSSSGGSSSATTYVDTDEGIGDAPEDDGGHNENEGARIVDDEPGIGDDEGNDRG